MGSFHFPVKIISGEGCLSILADEVNRLGAQRPLIVTDPGIVAAGIVDKVIGPLKIKNILYKLFDGVEPDPQMRHVVKAAEAVKKENHDLIIALGGGSSIDAAKAASILAVNDVDLRDLQGPRDAYPAEPLPIITVPTTAGSGSEVSSAAVIVDEEKKFKMYFKSPQIFSKVAFLDAQAVAGIPRHIAAATGADALTHAVESFFNPNRTFVTEAASLRATEIVFSNLHHFIHNTRDLKSAQDMLYASSLAGIAMTTAGLGLVHALAHPLGVKGHIPHALACALLLAPVLRFNRPAVSDRFMELALCIDRKIPAGMTGQKGIDDRVIQAVEELLSEIGIPKRLSDISATLDDVAGVVDESYDSFLSRVNPRPVSKADIESIIQKII
ncbi:MAG: iron-containing alcohol dehydrogenase [Deltaproteobacteria bacterium]|nr:iron-containing alcohol dehydrogenase [Deltaproteobacteria bacterium]